MDDTRFQEARQAYDAGDFRAASKLFLAAADGTLDGNGAAYHMAGNAFMRLRRFGDAIEVYESALRDRVYDKRGSVFFNLATAKAAIGEFPAAVRVYQTAIDEPGYDAPHKAFQGMASALLEMGRTDEAAAAYRRAALEASNPSPGAALLNLGLCLMALGRPADAAEAYKAALGVEGYAGRGKALANLGQAYRAIGDHVDAIRAFEQAEHLHDHELSPAARADLEASRRALGEQVASSEGTAESPQVEAQACPTVEGWVTGETPPVFESPAESTGWSTGELEALEAPEPEAFVPPEHLEPGVAPTPHASSSVVSDADDVNAFFNRTEAEMRDHDRELRREERRAHRGERNNWTIVFTVAGVLIGIVLVLAALYFSGYGWPTQRQITRGLLEAQVASKSVDAYWVAVPERDVAREMAKIPPARSFTIDSVEAGIATSTVAVTVTPKTGSPLRYLVTLQREGAGWRVSGLENDW